MCAHWTFWTDSPRYCSTPPWSLYFDIQRSYCSYWCWFWLWRRNSNYNVLVCSLDHSKGRLGYTVTPAPIHSPKKRGTGGFGSTGQAGIFLAEKISAIHPVCQIEIQSKRFTGLSDTGTRVSIISSQEWPKNSKVQEPNINLVGVGLHSSLPQARGTKGIFTALYCGHSSYSVGSRSAYTMESRTLDTTWTI